MRYSRAPPSGGQPCAWDLPTTSRIHTAVFPSPLWGGARGGGQCFWTQRISNCDPPPQPSPTRGREQARCVPPLCVNLIETCPSCHAQAAPALARKQATYSAAHTRKIGLQP